MQIYVGAKNTHNVCNVSVFEMFEQLRNEILLKTRWWLALRRKRAEKVIFQY